MTWILLNEDGERTVLENQAAKMDEIANRQGKANQNTVEGVELEKMVEELPSLQYQSNPQFELAEDRMPDSGSVFTDLQYLSPSYQPERLIGRQEEIKKATYFFKDWIDGDLSGHAILYGLPGSGKATVVRYLIRDVKEYLAKTSNPMNICDVYVSCAGTNIEVLTGIIHGIDETIPVPKSGLSLHEYFLIIISEINKRKLRLIVVLDEVDKFKAKFLFYNFSRLRSLEKLQEGASLTTISLSDDISGNFYKSLDVSTRGGFFPIHIQFWIYSRKELGDILRDRRPAFASGALDRKSIGVCADLAAKKRKNASYAIQLLRRAGEIADLEHDAIVTPDHVRKAKLSIDTDNAVECIAALPQRQRMLVSAIVSLNSERPKQEFTAHQVFERYGEIFTAAIRDTLTEPRLTRLLSELARREIITTRFDKKRRRGMQRMVRLRPRFRTAADAITNDFRSDPFNASSDSKGVQGIEPHSIRN